jgi:hypothetical protein
MTSEETVWVSGELAGLPTVESCGVGPLVENLGWKKAYDYVEKHGTPAKHGGFVQLWGQRAQNMVLLISGSQTHVQLLWRMYWEDRHLKS